MTDTTTTDTTPDAAADTADYAQETATPETQDSVAVADSADRGAGRDQGQVDDAKPDDTIGREAARYRRRLRAAEQTLELQNAALTDVTDTLERQRQAIVDAALTAAGIDPRLLAAAGHQLTDFLGEDGLIDTAKLSEAATTAVREFGVKPRTGLRPNPQQGMPSTGDGNTAATWGRLLGDAARRR